MKRLTLFAMALLGCGGAAHAVTAPVALTPEVVQAVTSAARPADVDAATAVHPHARCVLAVDFAASRTHPLAHAAAPTLARMPPFDALGADFDPLLDAEWMVYSAPRFFPNRDAAFVVRYSAADAAIDDAYHALAARDPVDDDDHSVLEGVVDRFPRALLRPQAGVAAMVPRALATRVTQSLSQGNVVPPLHHGEAVRVSMRRPGGVSTLVPDSVYEARAWVVLRDDGGADLFAELDCPFDSDAVVVANEVRRTVARYATGAARALVLGLLDGVEVRPDGRTVKLHVTATLAQGEALLRILDDRVGARAPP